MTDTRNFQVVTATRDGNIYQVRIHPRFHANNRYKMTANQQPIDVAKKAAKVLFTKTHEPNIGHLVIREITRGQPSKLFFYDVSVTELPPDRWIRRRIAGQDKVFKNQYNIRPLTQKELGHANPLRI